MLCTSQMGTGNVMGQTMRAVAVAKALQRRGHEIKFIAAGKMVPVIKSFGIDVCEADSMPGVPSAEIIPRMPEIMKEIKQIEMDAARREKPQLIISGTISGSTVARELKVPSIMTFLQPHGEKTINVFKGLMRHYDEQVMKTLLAGLLNAFEAANLIVLEGMPEISGGVTLETFGDALQSSKEKFRFAGPLLVEYPDQLPERDELKRVHIAEAHKKMAYITIGGSAMIGEQFLKTALESLKMIPEVTGVISTGIDISPEAIRNFDPPGNAIIRGFVPGTEMIKASDVTVFHGGSSTLMTCIACGTPAVVIPSMGEQEDNGGVLAQAGAGIVLDKKTLTPAILVESIQKVLHDSTYRTNAQQLKTTGEKYGGAGAVADWAEDLMQAGVR
ncbi:glycosyltransferase [Sporomusa aerivorans]|uniref:glycosyltransferase n=1 Tax=Sporomusa aerivorans TaxID=204936 RepID=UPI00352B2C30